MRRICLRILTILLLSALYAWGCKKTSVATADPPVIPKPLSATFIQLLDDHRTWSDTRWGMFFDYLVEVGIDELIIQWSVYEMRPFYGKPENDVLSTVLKIARQRGMRVWLGFVHDPAYWTQIQQEAGPLRRYLDASRNEMQRIAKALVARTDRPSNIVGWYISQEIDDLNFMSEEKRRILVSHLTKLSASLRRIAPRFRIAVSGFSNFHATPDALSIFWNDIAEKTGIDTIFFQDGLGVRKASWEALGRYFSALKQVAKRHRCSLRIVVELFEQVDGPPINDLLFRAIPAPWPRIQNQMRLASKYSDGNPAAFSIPEYATPMAGQRAQQLFNHLLKYVRRIHDEGKAQSR